MSPAEKTFRSWDGTELFYRAWLPGSGGNGSDRLGDGDWGQSPLPRKALLLFHRGHEHSGRWQETVDLLGLDDVAIFAWDARGHGRSPGERGTAENLAAIVKDVDAFVRYIAQEYEFAFQDIIVLAHSLAAVSVSAWVHDYAPPIRALILATAAFRVRLYVPLAIPFLRLRQKLFRPAYVKSYVKARMLTHDKEQAKWYEKDDLIFCQIAVNILLDLHDTGQRLVADAGAIHTPILMLCAGTDWVVTNKAQRKFFENLSSPVKRWRVFPGAYHALFHETNRREVVAEVRNFVRERFAHAALTPSLLEDKNEHSWREYERLKQHRPIKFALARAGLKTVGRLSRGVRLGWRTGFDSGLSLDYVYQNQPQGVTAIGRQIDRSYLQSIGWRGIRQRKVNLEMALSDLIDRVREEGKPVQILDIAAGAGRYVIETIHERSDIPISAILRDYKKENVEAARALANEFQLGNVTAETGDAFDPASMASNGGPATIGIVSGLYELFPDNALVLQSLRGMAEALQPGGYLIYTNQPWHPQVEMIARVLRNREGKPWIMRLRSTAEIDQLVRAAGFEKIDMQIDQWGMFSVSIARLAPKI